EVTVSNFAGSESSSATLVVYDAPTITVQPAAATTTAGKDAVFSVGATGYPLNYQWRFNGAPIAGATQSAYTVVGATPADIGYYSVVVSNQLGSETSSAALLTLAQILFADDFDSNTSANWAVNKSTGANANNAGNTAEFAFDYSTVGIPSAPNSTGGSRNGLRLRSNITGGIFSGLSVSPLNQSFTGDYELRFDLWQNYNGPVNGGGNGSTQVSGAGVGTAGTTAQWAGGVQDSIHFGATGDGGSGQDWRVYPRGALAAPASGIYAAGTTTTPDVRNEAHPYYASFGARTAPAEQVTLFPGQTGTSAVGTPGFKWLDVVIRKQGNSITWTVDNVLIATVNLSAITLGGNNILLNHYDINAASSTDANAAQMLFGLFDNVRVQAVVAPVITAQPADQTVATGNALTLSVAATSSTALRYQWRKDGVDIAGATGATYEVATASLSDAGSYSVVVLNDSTLVLSDSATVTVLAVDAPADLQVSKAPTATSVNQGTAVTFTLNSVSGTSPFSYQWYKGASPIAGATGTSYSIPAAQPGDSGSYSVEVSNLKATVMSESLSLTVIADSVAPMLKVLNPKANVIITGAGSVSVSGTATDDIGVKSVEVSVNDSAPQAAVFTSAKLVNWTVNASLTAGTNFITVVAKDFADNEFSVGPIRVFYHVPSPLTIQTNLNGMVITSNGVGQVLNTIALHAGNNTNLFIGRTYVLKALETGMPKYILTNWTATWVGQSSPVVLQTNNLTCTFEMKEGMVLSANFIDNPFYKFGGVYNGLFSEEDGIEFKSAGFATLKVTPKLGYSGKLFVDGNAVSFSGKLNLDGTGSLVTKARVKSFDKPELTVSIALDFAEGTETLSGTISEGSNWTSALSAHRVVWTTNVAEQATAFTNAYTMALPGFENNNAGPMGSSYGLVVVDRLGKIKLAGHMADGHQLKQGVQIS
ncbi:MAG: immunoglobulin domain-containing protein, partial [Limisphaerales bacterium]